MPLANSGPIKTYKEFIEYFESLCASHTGIEQFSVGEISDIDVQTNTKTPTKYPLVFLIPQQSFLDRFGKMTLGFSLLVADIAKNQEDLNTNTHNNTLMIMQDLFSRIILTDYETVDINLETPIAITPWQERFNNNLTGWTAEINVQLKSPFNLCEAAFDTGYVPPIPTTTSVYSQVIDFGAYPAYNSIRYLCNGSQVQACYSPGGFNNMTELVALFNSNPGTTPSCPDPTYCYCWTDYGTYYDNGDGRIRCEMPDTVYTTLCSGGTLTLDVIYD